MIVRARTFRATGLVAAVALLLAYSGGCATSEEVAPWSYDVGGSATTGGISGTGGTFTATGGTVTSTGGVSPSTGGASTGGASTGGAKATGGTLSSTGGIATSTTGGKPFGNTGGATGNTGGSAGKSAGGAAGGVGGSAGGAGGKSGGGGGGGADSCNWAMCTQEQCSSACPTNMGDYCATACGAIITCIRANPGCGTAADPMCVNRKAGTGAANVCTAQWESGSGSASPPGAPAQAAINYFKCACGVSPPNTGTGGKGGGGATSTGGKSGATGGASTSGGKGGGGATNTGGKG